MNVELKDEAASEAAFAAAQPGLAEIKLGDQAVMKLPADMVFIPKAQAQRLMKAHGNRSDPTMMGMVLPQKDDEDWAVTVNFEKSGFIKEDDANNWDTAELLKSLQEGTERQALWRLRFVDRQGGRIRSGRAGGRCCCQKAGAAGGDRRLPGQIRQAGLAGRCGCRPQSHRSGFTSAARRDWRPGSRGPRQCRPAAGFASLRPVWPRATAAPAPARSRLWPRIARINAQRQFEIIYSARAAVRPVPYLVDHALDPEALALP